MTIGYVLVNCELGAEEDVIKKLKDHEQINDAFGTFGAHDIIAIVEAEHLEKLREIITWDIQKMDKVRSTVSLVKKEIE